MIVVLPVCGVIIQEIGGDISSGLMVKLNLIISTALPLNCIAPDLGSGRPGATEIDEQKKGHRKFFFLHLSFFLNLLSPLSFPWFPWLFLPSLRRLNVKEIFLFLVGGPLLLWWEAWGPGLMPPP
jgi:hypothetical protein